MSIRCRMVSLIQALIVLTLLAGCGPSGPAPTLTALPSPLPPLITPQPTFTAPPPPEGPLPTPTQVAREHIYSIRIDPTTMPRLWLTGIVPAPYHPPQFSAYGLSTDRQAVIVGTIVDKWFYGYDLVNIMPLMFWNDEHPQPDVGDEIGITVGDEYGVYPHFNGEELLIYSFTERRGRGSLAGHNNLEAFAVSPDGLTVATVDSESLRIWDVWIWRLSTTLPRAGNSGQPPIERVTALEFSGNGSKLFVGSQGNIDVWDMSMRRYESSFALAHAAPGADVEQIMALPRGGPLITLSSGTIEIRHPETYQLLAAIPAGAIHFDVNIRHDLIVATTDEGFDIYELWTGQRLYGAKIERTPLHRVHFTRNDTILLAVREHELQFWSIGPNTMLSP